MATNERVEALKIRIQLDKQALDQASKGWAGFRKEFEAYRAESEATNRELERMALALQQQKIAEEQAKQAVRQTSQTLSQRAQLQKDLRNEIEQTARAITEEERATANLNREQQNRGRSGLAKIGYEIRALPSVSLGGALTTDAVGKIVNLIGQLDNQSGDAEKNITSLRDGLARLKTGAVNVIKEIGVGKVGLIGGLAVAAIAVKVLTDQFARMKAEATGVLDEALNYFNLIQDGTTDSLTALKDQKQAEIDVAKARKDAADAALQSYRDQVAAANANDPLRILIGEFNAAIGTGSGELAALKEASDAASKSLQETEKGLNAINAALVSPEVARNDAALLRAQQIKQTDDLLLRRLQVQQQFANQSVDTIDKQIESIQRSISSNYDLINTEGLSADAKEALRKETLLLTTDLATLTQVVRPAAQAAEEAAQAEEDLKRSREETADATKEYLDQVKDLEEKAAQERIDINNKYAETVIEIAEKAADAAEDALRKLQERREDLARDLARDFTQGDIDAARKIVDERIKAQRDEAKALRAHLANLKRIQQQYNQDSATAIENRDAVALANAQRTRNQAIKDERRRYDEEAQERQIALQQRLQDQRIALDQEREDRLRKYQQDLQDADIQYQRELAQAERQRQEALVKAQQQYEREIALLEQKNAAQLRIYQKDYVESVRYAQLGSTARQKIMDAEIRRYNAIASNILSGLGGLAGSSSSSSSGSSNASYLIRRASGGSLQPFQTAAVNEPGSSGRESFTSMGKTMAFPGAGLFTPFRSGIVNANRGGGGNTANIYVQLDGQTFKAMSKQQALNALGEVLDSMGAA